MENRILEPFVHNSQYSEHETGVCKQCRGQISLNVYLVMKTYDDISFQSNQQTIVEVSFEHG